MCSVIILILSGPKQFLNIFRLLTENRGNSRNYNL